MKRSILLTGVATLALTGGAAWADSGYHGNGGYMMGGYGHGFLGGSVMILFWIAVIALIVLGVRWLAQNGGGEKRSSALDILQDRLARGEIDAEEYQARKNALDA